MTEKHAKKSHSHAIDLTEQGSAKDPHGQSLTIS